MGAKLDFMKSQLKKLGPVGLKLADQLAAGVDRLAAQYPGGGGGSLRDMLGIQQAQQARLEAQKDAAQNARQLQAIQNRVVGSYLGAANRNQTAASRAQTAQARSAARSAAQLQAIQNRVLNAYRRARTP